MARVRLIPLLFVVCSCACAGARADDVKSALDAEREALNKLYRTVRDKKASPQETRELERKILAPAMERTQKAVVERSIEERKAKAAKAAEEANAIREKGRGKLVRQRQRQAALEAEALARGKAPQTPAQRRARAKAATAKAAGAVAGTGAAKRPPPSPTPVPQKSEEVVLDGSDVPKELEFRRRKRFLGKPSPSPEAPDEKLPSGGEALDAVGGGEAVDEVEFEKARPSPKAGTSPGR
jgi:hypothetical protein